MGQGAQRLGYVEQLYTFADKDRTAGGQTRTVSIGYLALVRAAAAAAGSSWSPWYRHFPWEDHRKGVPELITDVIMPQLNKWKAAPADAAAKRSRAQRIDVAFPKDMHRWNEELVLQRYELLWEAGLVEEAKRQAKGAAVLGVPMAQDHRRILATAMARLRAKIKYRPVVFELMPDAFTLLQLQGAVEALAGLRLHKQNFRRLVEAQGLVEGRLYDRRSCRASGQAVRLPPRGLGRTRGCGNEVAAHGVIIWNVRRFFLCGFFCARSLCSG